MMSTNRHTVLRWRPKALEIVLRVTGALLLTALIPAVMPFAWMQGIHRLLGMEELPEMPITGYLTRSLSAMYALHGVLVLFVSLDVRRYLPVVKCLAVLGILFGLSMLVLDFTVGMPWFWSVCEGPIVVILGGAILGLSKSVEVSEAEDEHRDRRKRSEDMQDV